MATSAERRRSSRSCRQRYPALDYSALNDGDLLLNKTSPAFFELICSSAFAEDNFARHAAEDVTADFLLRSQCRSQCLNLPARIRSLADVLPVARAATSSPRQIMGLSSCARSWV